MKVHIYNTRSFVSLFNGREIFWLVMMLLGGGRAIITLRAADRDRGRRRGCQRLWEVTCRHFIPVPSLCRWRNVGHSRLLWWRARLAYFSQWSGQTYPDRICRSSGCDICECRVLLPEEVRIREARHMHYWRNPDWVIRMRIRITCHQEMCATWHQGEGSLQQPQYKNLPLFKNLGIKNVFNN